MERITRLISSFHLSRSTAVALARVRLCGREEVYDLTVPQGENFTVCGGLVAHNCVDAARYGLMTLHEQKSKRPKTEIEKKLEEFKAKDSINPRGLNEFYMPPS